MVYKGTFLFRFFSWVLSPFLPDRLQLLLGPLMAECEGIVLVLEPGIAPKQQHRHDANYTQQHTKAEDNPKQRSIRQVIG